MTEIWDIARYVEEHPDDYEQRWRLAKKLYTAWEYRLALEHLQVLRNEWQQKLNVVRYLAATYYRLGRYDEAAGELRSAIETWPQEIGLREQLARVLEIAGEKLQAADVWETINGIDPHHPIAANAVKRLRAKPDESAQEDLKLTDSDSGIDLSPGRVCPNCGAQNSDEFERCWQCHALLIPEQSTPHPTPLKQERRMPVLSPETLILIAGTVVLGLLTLSVYLSLRLLIGSPAETGAARAVSTFEELYTREIGPSRVITGLVLLAGWPFALWTLLRVLKAPPIPVALVNVTGLLLAVLTYVASWLPPNLLSFVLILPALVSLAIIAGAFGLGAPRALNVWILHLALVLLITLATFTLCESIRIGQFLNPASEIPAVLAYAHRQAEFKTPGTYTIPGEVLPITQQVQWQSTGSAWLDHHAGSVKFTVYSEAEPAALKFEINQGETQPRVLETVRGRLWTHLYRVKSGEPYFIKLIGPQGAPVRIEMTCMLIPRFLS